MCGNHTYQYTMLFVSTDLATAVVTHVTFEPLLILMGLLMLDQSIALMEDGIAVTTLLASLNKRMLLTKMDP